MRFTYLGVVGLVVSCGGIIAGGDVGSSSGAGSANVQTNLTSMPSSTSNSVTAVKTSTRFQDVPERAIALSITNVVVPGNVCGTTTLDMASFTGTFDLGIMFGADPTSGDPTPGTYGPDAALAAFGLHGKTCAPGDISIQQATDILVTVQSVQNGVIDGRAELTFGDTRFSVSFSAPMCDQVPAASGTCTQLPLCTSDASSPCVTWM